ncbi:MAG TPA: ATP-dependent DNA helicase RecQ, partial [Flavobacteriaceae bacterium]|nr:ATP-dependent DNA helicase RecQ [Flavobacteriaceae bacterium]
DVVAFAETSISRRKFILHYFGEEFDNETGEGGAMDDNMRHPKKKHESKDELSDLLNAIAQTHQKYKAKEIVHVMRGKVNALIKSHKTDALPIFGSGSEHPSEYWMALIRQALVAGLLTKDIETYGVLKISKTGYEFLESPSSFMMAEDHSYKDANDDLIVNSGGQVGAVADQTLFKLLKAQRKTIADKLGLPPFVIFQDPSLEDMALKYPITLDELSNVHGVGEGKAKKYGASFVTLIDNYVTENQIMRPDDFVVKSTGSNSALKLYIIQSVDRKLPLTDIAQAKGLQMDDFIKEMEAIVYSGTKLNIDYYLEDILDDDSQEELHDYFMEADNDQVEPALEAFDGDFDEEEIRLYRIKFISDVAN